MEDFANIVGASVKAVELWHSEGMPAEVEKPTGRRGRPRLRINLEKATNWMIAHKRGGFNVPDLPDVSRALPKGKISDEPGLVGAIDRAKAAERLSFHLLRDAIARRDNMGVRATLDNWHAIAKTLSDMEKRHSQQDVLTSEIRERTQQDLREWCEPKRAFIETIPHAFASRLLNLKKAAQVEAVLNELVASLLKQLAEPLKFKTQTKEEK